MIVMDHLLFRSLFPSLPSAPGVIQVHYRGVSPIASLADNLAMPGQSFNCGPKMADLADGQMFVEISLGRVVFNVSVSHDLATAMVVMCYLLSLLWYRIQSRNCRRLSMINITFIYVLSD